MSGEDSAHDRSPPVEVDTEELGDRLRKATPTDRHLFALLSRSGTLEVLYEVGMHGPLRFNELRRCLDISSATLSARLSELVDAEFIKRTSYDEIPPRVEYSPTERLTDLKPILIRFVDWAERHQVTLNESPGSDESSPG
jgi:DNA-binding HxlR family transcriptional regulator